MKINKIVSGSQISGCTGTALDFTDQGPNSGTG